MNSQERVVTALNHKEPDRVPFDLGGSDVSGIHILAYQNLRRYLGLPELPPRLDDMMQQVGTMDDDMHGLLRTDVRWVSPIALNFDALTQMRDEGDYWAYDDEWGIGWHMPKEGGLYYDMYKHPMQNAETPADLAGYRWPDGADPGRFTGLRDRAKAMHDAGKAVCIASQNAGMVEMHAWLRGYEQFYYDLAANHRMVEYILDKVTEAKIAYWGRALAETREYIHVVLEYDDMAGQNALMFSPETYRKLIKPYHKQLFSFIKQQAPDKKLFLHCCGAVRPLIPDLIEIGVDILNPVQVSAAGMDSAELKREFGRDLVFWGGGVDTLGVAVTGTPRQVREEVKRRIEDFAPGGGFVFAAVHNIQPNFPPENIMAMWETLQEYGVYRH